VEDAPSILNIVSYIGNVVGIVAFAVQLTLILTRSKNDQRLRYLFKSINDVALSKALAWTEQADRRAGDRSDAELDLIKNAAAEFKEVSSLASSLERSISSDVSASADS
jgi:hypothetical protein